MGGVCAAGARWQCAGAGDHIERSESAFDSFSSILCTLLKSAGMTPCQSWIRVEREIGQCMSDVSVHIARSWNRRGEMSGWDRVLGCTVLSRAVLRADEAAVV